MNIEPIRSVPVARRELGKALEAGVLMCECAYAVPAP